jgi:tRNA pseudouridine55 synthase
VKNILIINKELGETPLEALEKARLENDIPSDVPMTYAGRLDPLAEGVLLILVGEECKRKEKYLNLDKEYEVEVLLGVKTDSYDPLGVIKEIKDIHEENLDFRKYICKFSQKYPAYSSKVIAMKDVPEVLPSNEVEIFSIEKIGAREIFGSDLVREVFRKIEKVKGDFRQDKIRESWLDFLNKYEEKMFKIIKIKVLCSSGTYMRSLSNSLEGLAFSIKRTKVGDYTLM